jgi:hypothetical protein
MKEHPQHVARKNIYIALEELNFIWDEHRLEDFIYLWDEGQPLINISKYFKRDVDEVLVLVIDLARKGRITPRKGGLMGCMLTED